MNMQELNPIRPLWEGVEKSSGPRAAGPAVPFADVFASAVENVRETDAAKNEAEYLLATGQLDNPAELTIASTRAAMSVELLVQLRNKALEAYNELMRISM